MKIKLSRLNITTVARLRKIHSRAQSFIKESQEYGHLRIYYLKETTIDTWCKQLFETGEVDESSILIIMWQKCFNKVSRQNDFESPVIGRVLDGLRKIALGNNNTIILRRRQIRIKRYRRICVLLKS